MEQNQLNKRCSKCGGNGPFGKDKRRKDGLQSRCKSCDRNAKRALRQKQPAIEREKLYKWREEHPDRFRQHINKYRQNNLARERKNHKKYYENHREEILNKSKKYQQENPDVYRNSNRRRRARIKGAEGNFTKKEWTQLQIDYGYRCAYCNAVFQTVEPDHIISLSRGGSNYISNIIPSCKSCNASKQDTPLLIWLMNRL